MINPEDFEETKEERYEGSAETLQVEKDAVGGEKTLAITNHLFQSDADAQTMADALLLRFKSRKKYFSAIAEFCPVPVEPDDTILMQERIIDAAISAHPYGDENKKYGDPSRLYRYNGRLINHLGIIRDIKLSVTPTNQSLTLVLEVNQSVNS